MGRVVDQTPLKKTSPICTYVQNQRQYLFQTLLVDPDSLVPKVPARDQVPKDKCEVGFALLGELQEVPGTSSTL